MTPEQIAWWWCCIRSEDRYALAAIAAFFVAAPLETPRAAVDAILILAGYTVGEAPYNVFIATYQLSFEEVIVEELPVEMTVFDVAFWIPQSVFLATYDTTCPEPCYILKFAQDHL